jgi:N-dimethylarginine dimethylaminohydrolase
VDSAHGGDDWQQRPTALSDELGSLWRDCGVSYEWGKLRSVLLHHPGSEIENITDPSAVLWTEALHPALAREQHRNLANFYENLGVEVNYIKAGTDTSTKPNLYFVRDLFTMTPNGAVVSRPASQVRAGEECIISRTLADLNVPILLTPYGEAFLEGPDILLVSDDLAFVGTGLRTNHQGAELAARLLKDIGYGQVVKVQTTYGCGHLDGVVSIIDKDLALLYPTRISYVVYETLRQHGFRLLDLPDGVEAQTGMAINIVPLEPGRVLLPHNNPRTKQLLNSSGVECDEIDVSELMKGGGSVHCMTGVLKRER